MRTEVKSETRRQFVVAIVASVVAVVTFALPQSWQTMLTEAVVAPASADAVRATYWDRHNRLFQATYEGYKRAFNPTATDKFGPGDSRIVTVSLRKGDTPPEELGTRIPDGTTGGIDIPIQVPAVQMGSPYTSQVDLRLHIKHPWLSDLVITLTNPQGHTVTLFDRMGPTEVSGNRLLLHACSKVGMDVTWVETAAESEVLDVSKCRRNNSLLKGLFKTEGSVLTQFNGRRSIPYGVWVLNISDRSNQDRGHLVAADLTVVSRGGW